MTQLVECVMPKGTWYLAYLPKNIAQEIRFFAPAKGRGWGAIPVDVRVGTSSWKASLFPDKKSGSYLMLVKADIRKKEALVASSEFECHLKTR